MVFAQTDLVDCLEVVHTVDGHLLPFVIAQVQLPAVIFFSPLRHSVSAWNLPQDGLSFLGEPQFYPILMELWCSLDREWLLW